ncbi:MAG: efflux RND transporter periplasmic adaptor subunit [Acidobacteria bacterium]|nr:efflux RND transporter periplasmic adaptor subunit [Acidobacteriota bacterium]MBI3424540.1 efflux RND transporter periplasmic adaptor subunit [Acidobacteriota bacterium]
MNQPNNRFEEHHSENAAPPSAVRLRSRGLAVLLLLLLGAGSVLWYRYNNQPTATAAAQSVAKPAPAAAAAPEAAAPPGVAQASELEMNQISVEPVIERQLDLERETTGKVGFNEDRITPVFPNCGGRVTEVLVKKGDYVKAGQPLLVLESPEVVAAESELAAAITAESSAATAQDVARKTLERAQGLHEREALSTRELQEAQAAYDRAKDEQHRTRAAVRVAEARLGLYGKTPEEVATLGDLGRKNVGQVDNRVIIRAPLSGTIVDRKVGQGQYVRQEASEPLVLLSDLSSLWVLAEVYESFLSRIHIGAPVMISVAAYPERKFPARISFINPTVDPETRTVRVRCVVQNPNLMLKPEMFARISIGAATPQPFPAVPTSAIFTQGTDAFAFVEETPRQFHKRPVKVGRQVDDHILVESGLRTGERVATHGVLLLNGMVK